MNLEFGHSVHESGRQRRVPSGLAHSDPIVAKEKRFKAMRDCVSVDPRAPAASLPDLRLLLFKIQEIRTS